MVWAFFYENAGLGASPAKQFSFLIISAYQPIKMKVSTYAQFLNQIFLHKGRQGSFIISYSTLFTMKWNEKHAMRTSIMTNLHQNTHLVQNKSQQCWSSLIPYSWKSPSLQLSEVTRRNLPHCQRKCPAPPVHIKTPLTYIHQITKLYKTSLSCSLIWIIEQFNAAPWYKLKKQNEKDYQTGAYY